MIPTRTVEHEGFTIEYFHNDCLAVNSIEKGKRWESHIVDFVHALPPLHTVVDVGANFGYHTLFFARHAQTVIALEPQVQNYTLLHKNVHTHNKLTNVHTIPQACGDSLNLVYLPMIAADAPYPVNMGDFTLASSSTTGTHVTTVAPLDSIPFHTRVDLIKIDVQGWECHTLHGAVKTITRDAPILIVEFETHQLVKTGTTCAALASLIRDMGYTIFFLDYTYPSDHVCVHASQLDEFRTRFASWIQPHTKDNSVNNNVNFGVTEKLVKP